MNRRRIVIIGGVAAGTSAAAKARRCDEHVEIVIFEKGEHISYAMCGLPYYISGIIPLKRQLIFKTPNIFKVRHNINGKTEHVLLTLIQY